MIKVGDYVLHDDQNENCFNVGKVTHIYDGGEFDIEFCHGGTASPIGGIVDCKVIRKETAEEIQKLIDHAFSTGLYKAEE